MTDNNSTSNTPTSDFRPPNSGKFDPITLEILWRRLISIVDEADASVARTAFSSLLRDAHDYTCMFTDSRGQELVQGTFCTPGQAGAMALFGDEAASALGLKPVCHNPYMITVAQVVEIAHRLAAGDRIEIVHAVGGG